MQSEISNKSKRRVYLCITDIFRSSIPDTIVLQDEILELCKNLSEGYEEQSSIKLIVLGHGRIGKSTLVHFFQHLNNTAVKVKYYYQFILSYFTHYQQRFLKKFTSKAHPSEFAGTSTIGIDHHTLATSQGMITIFDFAGQLEYTVTHQYFLSSEVLYNYLFEL